MAFFSLTHQLAYPRPPAVFTPEIHGRYQRSLRGEISPEDLLQGKPEALQAQGIAANCPLGGRPPVHRHPGPSTGSRAFRTCSYMEQPAAEASGNRGGMATTSK